MRIGLVAVLASLVLSGCLGGPFPLAGEWEHDSGASVWYFEDPDGDRGPYWFIVDMGSGPTTVEGIYEADPLKDGTIIITLMDYVGGSRERHRVVFEDGGQVSVWHASDGAVHRYERIGDETRPPGY